MSKEREMGSRRYAPLEPTEEELLAAKLGVAMDLAYYMVLHGDFIIKKDPPDWGDPLNLPKRTIVGMKIKLMTK